ncbi:MAG: OpgC family protein [Alphaproteobacteria bacterium]
MNRLEILDGLRGYFLVFMLLNHLRFAGGYMLVKINHAELGFVEDAQGFVFLSGLLIGMVYSRKMARQGFGPAAGAIWSRASELYGYALGCLVVVLVLHRLLPDSDIYWGPWLHDLDLGAARLMTAAAALLYQPTYMDILPQYIVYLIVAPPLVWLCVRGRWHWVASGCVVAWLATQLGLHLPAATAIHDAWALRAHFNVLTWQVLFIGGMILGALTVSGQIDWERVFRPDRPHLAVVASVALLFFLIWRIWTSYFPIPDPLMERFVAHGNRGEFGLIYLLNFAALAYLVTWTIRAGPDAAHAPVRRMAGLLSGLFTLSFLRLLGRHSLQVYAWHVILVYLLKAVDHGIGPFNEATKTLIALTGVMLLAVPALLRERPRRELSHSHG